MEPSTFAEVFYAAYRDSGLTLAEIATRLQARGYPVSKGTLSRWAAGAVKPGRASLPLLRLAPAVLQLDQDARRRFDQALQALFEGVEARPDADRPAAAQRRAHTLGALAYFAGRQRELRRLLPLLRARRSVSLSGLGGIGKTTLARQLLLLSRDQFALGCDSLQLHPSQPLPEVLAQVVQCLGLPIAFDPAQPGQVETALRALAVETRGLDLLFLLDNVESEAQVGRLLAAAPAITWLTTSRRRLDFKDWVSFPLALPTAAAAAGILLHNADLPPTRANRAQAAQVVARLGRLPIALRIAAGLIRVGSFSGLADLHHWLAAEGLRALRHDDDDKDLLTFFARLLERLPADVQRLFELCGAFTQRLIRRENFEAAAQRLQLPGKALGTLASLSLVYWQPEEDFFELHPLIHEYAAARFQAEPGADAARAALAETYAEFVASQAGQHPVLAAEFDNIAAAMDWAAAAGRWELLHRFWPAISEHLWTTGDHVRYQHWEARWLAGCRARGDALTEAAILSELCYLAIVEGRYAAAEELGEASQAIYDRLGLVQFRVRLRRYRAIVRMRQGRLAEAEALVSEMDALLEPLLAAPDAPGSIVERQYTLLLNCHAALATRQRAYRVAQAAVTRALARSRQLGQTDYTGLLLLQCGDVAYLLGQTAEARQFWLEAEAFERQPHIIGHATPEVLLRLAAYESLHGQRAKALRLTHAVRRGYARAPQALTQARAERLIAQIRSGPDVAALLLELLHDT